MNDQNVNDLMELAQEFASSWSIVGGKFDGGNAMDDAKVAKSELRRAIESALSQQNHIENKLDMVKQGDAPAVAWVDGNGHIQFVRGIDLRIGDKLYAAPPEVAAYDSRNDVAALREDKLLLNARIDELLPEVAALQARITELESEAEQLRMSWHNARIANSWISINDRLPELDERIIAFRPDAHMGPQFDENIALRTYLGGKFSGVHAVTHWMPLPAAPKPDSEKP